MSESIEEVARAYYHGLSDKQWDECKDTFPYCKIAAIAKDYARQKCREQRKICADNLKDYLSTHEYTATKEDAILSAPKPEFN